VTSPPRVIGRRVRAGAVVALLWALAFTTLYPFIFVLMTSVRTDADYTASPTGILQSFTWSNISYAWNESGLRDDVVNSVIIVVVAVVLLSIVAAMAGFALAHLKVPLGKSLLGVSVACMIIPPSVLMIPIFQVVQDLSLLNQRLGLILVYVSLNLPFSVYLMTTYMRAVPKQLFEAARVDGAGALRSLVFVAIPLARPALATLATLNFLTLWNELLFSLILLQDGKQHTLTVGIASAQGRFLTSVPSVAGGLIFSIIPPLLVFVFFQRDLVRGLTAGAVK